MRKGPKAAFVLLVILLPCCAFALDPSLDISQYAHTAWKVRDGFPKGIIRAIAQSPDGYLWLATEFGLIRFDGTRAVPWLPPSGQRLPVDNISSFLVGRDGAFWIGTDAGLARWKDGKLSTYQELNGKEVDSIIEDGEGTIWAGEWRSQRPNELCAVRGGRVDCYGNDGSLGEGVLSLYEDGNANLWVGAAGGFWRWKRGPPKFYPLSKQDRNIAVLSFMEGVGGSLFIGARGVNRFFSNKLDPHKYLLPQSAQHLRARLFKDRDGSVWIGTSGGGLVHVHNGRTDIFQESDGLSGNSVAAMFEDREGNVWVATEKGLDRFRNLAVATWSSRQGLAISPWSGVLAAHDGAVWTGVTNGLAAINNKGQVTIYRRQSGRTRDESVQLPREKIDRALPEQVQALFQDHPGRLWISYVGGLGHLEAGHFFRIPSFGPRIPIAIVESAGNLWVSGEGAGLFRLRDGKVLQKIPWETLGRKDYGWRLAADGDGGLWIGYRTNGGGIAYFKDGHVRATYSAADGLGGGWVNDIRFEPPGTVWAATENGLSRIQDGRALTLTSKNGLPCDAVHWSIEDDDHFVWLYMSCGLVRIALSELEAWTKDTNGKLQVRVFDASDGVRTVMRSYVPSPQVTKAHDGKIWFVELDGIGVIDPHHLPFNKIPPPVHVEQITADNKTYDAVNGLRLPPRVRNLAIDYTAVSLVIPEKVRFRIKLEGQDKDWRELVNIREMQYTNLAPGNYRFRVTACNNSGVWSEEGATLDFAVLPAWYQTNWFRAACVVAFLAMIWAAYQLRVRQLAYQFNLRLDERVSERTRIARDLHDTLLQSFHGLLMKFQTVSHLLPGNPIAAKEKLDNTIEKAEEVIVEGRDTVQGLRASTVQSNNLAQAISMLREELAGSSDAPRAPEFRVAVEGVSRDLHPILRDEIYRIAAEALRNAYRHAQARQIEVEIRYDDRGFRLRVRDDGRGIDPAVLARQRREGHYGLPGMHERARIAGGKLTVWSEIGAGTEVELHIPAGSAYVKAPRRLWGRAVGGSGAQSGR